MALRAGRTPHVRSGMLCNIGSQRDKHWALGVLMKMRKAFAPPGRRSVGLVACLLLLCPALPFAQTEPSNSCRSCHRQAKTQPATAMAQALENVADCAVLIHNPVLIFADGGYSYRIERRGNQSFYTVTSGTQSVTLPIRFAVGSSAAVGQTYILEHEGELYESRVSYFSEVGGLAITIGHNTSSPATLLEAAGRRLRSEEKLRCLGCHSTGAVRQGELLLDKLTPGVQCSHCHENVALHLDGMLKGDPDAVTMKRLSTLSAGDISNFCGQCHRTWEQIALSGVHDITTLRFQPYRLAGSKCFDEDDPRISCIACHDPHKEVDTVAEHYDSRCLSCHTTAKAKPGVCKVGKTGCTNCHMPKIELPGAHHKFADHRIRIVKPGEKFPG